MSSTKPKQLTRLTPAQQRLLVEVRQDWINRFNSLEFDEAASRAFVAFLYRLAGQPAPVTVVLDSPLALQVAANLLAGKRGQVGGQVWEQVQGQVESQVRGQVESQVRGQVRGQVRDQVGGQVESQVGDQVFDQVEAQVWDQVGGQVSGQVMSQVRGQVEAQVRSQVGGQVRSQVGDHKLHYFSESLYGRCDDAGWVSFFDFFDRLGLIQSPLFTEYRQGLKGGLFSFIALDGLALVSRPPVFLNRDARGRMHCLDDCAIAFADGFGLHYVHGVHFTLDQFGPIKARTVTGTDILALRNAEQKAALVQAFGYATILDALPTHRVLDEYRGKSKHDGQPVSYQVIDADLDGLPIRFVKVECHTTHKIVCLGVPREKQTETCLGAIKWTFNLPGTAPYAPIQET